MLVHQVELAQHGRFELCRRDVRVRRGINHQQVTTLSQIVCEGARLGRDPLLPHQRLLKTTAGAQAEDGGSQ